jgi:predicted phage-related endonuclease
MGATETAVLGSAPAMVDLGRGALVPITPDLRFEVGDRLGTAVFEGYRPTHSDAWHEQRATGYGGSDVAAICNCSKWQTPYQLWAERTGLVPREDDGKNVDEKRWGTILEPVILQHYAERNPGLVVITAPPGFDMSWRHAERGYQLASPDALWYSQSLDTWGIVEAKTSRYDDDWRDDDRSWLAPSYYRTQEQWYLDAFGFDLGVFAVLFSGSDYVEIPVAADSVEQRINRKEVEWFDQLVQTEQPPEFTGTDGEVTTVRKMHPDIDGTEVDLDSAGTQWLAARRAAAEAEAQLNIAAVGVLQVMGQAKHGLVDRKRVVSRQSRGNGTPYLVAARGLDK